MPALPPLFHRSAKAAASSALSAAQDTRILDSRQPHITATTTETISSLTTRTLAPLLKRLSSPATLLKRNSDSSVCRAGYIAGCYQFGGASPGAVVGIVLGAIAGFLLIIWLLWVLSNGTTFIQTSNLQEEDVVVSRRTERSSGRSRRSHRSSHREEMRHNSPRRERVIRQERIVRDVPVQTRREGSRVRETVIVEESRPERRVEGDDIVEVIEEHSSIGGAPPPRRNRRRSSGYR